MRRTFRPSNLRRKHIQITGGEILLNKGSSGPASSYSSVKEYVETTGVPLKGYGVGGSLEEKLSKLVLNPVRKEMKKRNNIKLSL